MTPLERYGKKPNRNTLLSNVLYSSASQYKLWVYFMVQDYIGRCILTLTRVIMEEEYKDWFPLDESKAGKIQLHLKWMAQSIYRDS